MVARTGSGLNEYFGNGVVPAGFVLGGTLDATGNNTVTALGGADYILGTAANDVIRPGAGDDYVNGGAGTDTISYSDATAAVTVSLALTTAQNTLGSGSDTILNVERLEGSSFNDTLEGNEGANTVWGGTGVDTIFGRGGDDYLNGQDGADLIEAGFGNDVLYGELGNDNLRGQRGNDLMVGGFGNDRMTGGKGDDIYVGGANDDVFVWTQECLTLGTYTDVVVDMQAGDVILHAWTVQSRIAGYAEATGLPEARQGVALNNDPSILDARVVLTTTLDSVTYTTTAWILDVGANSLEKVNTAAGPTIDFI